MPITTAHAHCVVQLKAHFMSKDLYVYTVQARFTTNGQLASPSIRCDDIGVEMRTIVTRHETRLAQRWLVYQRPRCACSSGPLHAHADLQPQAHKAQNKIRAHNVANHS